MLIDRKVRPTCEAQARICLTSTSQAGSWLAGLAAGLALQSAPLPAYGAEASAVAQQEALTQASPDCGVEDDAMSIMSSSRRLQAPQLVAQGAIDAPRNCRPRCIWGDAVCRALLGERWSDTGERCDADAPELLPDELRGGDDTQPPYVSAPKQQSGRGCA